MIKGMQGEQGYEGSEGPKGPKVAIVVFIQCCKKKKPCTALQYKNDHRNSFTDSVFMIYGLL